MIKGISCAKGLKCAAWAWMFGFALLTAFLLFGLQTRTALAEPPSDIIQAPMVVDCDTSAPRALPMLKAKGLCPEEGGVAPDNIVYGNCGSAFLWIYDHGTGGYAGFSQGVDSTLGAIVYLNHNLTWTNWSQGRTGGWSGSAFPFSSSWTKNTEAFTDAGYVTGAWSGYVILWNGIRCNILNPSDSETIT